MRAGSAISPLATRRSATCRALRATWPGRSRATATALQSVRSWPSRIPAMPAGSAISRCRYKKVGDVLVAQGKLAGRSRATATASPSPSGWPSSRSQQYRLAARSLGVVRQGRRRAGGAGQARRGAQELPRQPRHRRAAGQADPGNAGWQRDLSRSLREGRRRAGGAGQARRRRSRATATASPFAERLAAPIPAMPGGSAISRCRYNKVGDVLVAQGKLDEALKSYRDSLAIVERLAKPDPSNAGWQRDLSVSYERVGNVQSAQGNSTGRSRATATASPSVRGWPSRSRQCRLAARSLGLATRESATCRARRATRRGAQELPRQPCNPREAGQAGSRQCRLAARPSD